MSRRLSGVEQWARKAALYCGILLLCCINHFYTYFKNLVSIKLIRGKLCHILTIHNYFSEFLAGSGSTPTIFTYISAIKSKCSQFGIPSPPGLTPVSEYHAQILFQDNHEPPWPQTGFNPPSFGPAHTASQPLPLGPLYTAPTIPYYPHHYHVRVPKVQPLNLGLGIDYYVLYCYGLN